MKDAKKNMTAKQGTVLAAAIFMIGGLCTASSNQAAPIATAIDVPVLSADGGVAPPPPIILPGGSKRA
jgi:hypothetical protein